MACFHPLDAWQLESGEVVFSERGKVLRSLVLPCGRCIGCRQVRQRSWALRCLHEAQMAGASSFVTLTYDDDHFHPSLNYSDFQRFMYRLRRSHGPTRFFVCGEYGENTLRPHFHALLFGRVFDDLLPIGKDLYCSKQLSKLWPFGFSSVGSVTYESAAYVAGYCLKKVTGARADHYYTRVDPNTGEVVYCEPEFGHMSLKPGIGYSWFVKFWKEVYIARDGVVRPGGSVCPPPRFYDKKLSEFDGDLSDHVAFRRYLRSSAFAVDGTPQRLLDREAVAKARLKQKRHVL